MFDLKKFLAMSEDEQRMSEDEHRKAVAEYLPKEIKMICNQSLADLAFRLQMENKKNPRYFDCLTAIWKLRLKGDCVPSFITWLAYDIAPIDRIAAALEAMKGKKKWVTK
jgi:hypothetical protein